MQAYIDQMQEELQRLYMGAGLMQSHNEHLDSAMLSGERWSGNGPRRHPK